MKNVFGICALLFGLIPVGLGQSPVKTEQQVGGDITGLYSFLHEGEFVQIEESDGKISGLISRFKNENLEKPEFVDQFFDEAKLDGTALSFRTKELNGESFEFLGTVERGTGKTPKDEGYWNVRGRLTEKRVGTDGKVSEKTHDLTLKSFPQDTEPNAVSGGSGDENKE